MAKKLGKGLGALIKSYESDKRKNDLNKELPLKNIIPNRNQPRQTFNNQDMQDLVLSVSKRGVLQPVSVRKINGKFELIAGERRFRAAQKAKLKTIPAYIIDIKNESQMMEYALIENIQRVDLNPLEEAEGYAILSGKYNFTHAAIAEAVSKSRTEVSNKMRLLNLPPKVKIGLKQSVIEYGHARALLSLKESTKIIKIFKLVIKSKLNVRQTELLTKKLKSNNVHKIKLSSKSQSFKDTEVDLQNFLETKITIKNVSKNKGAIIIEFISSDDLNRIVRKIKKNNFFL